MQLKRFPIGYILFWGIAIILAVGAFRFARDFTICWRLTSLPGLPPKACSTEPVYALEPPVLVDKSLITERTPTPEPSIPVEINYPTWDGASRINILFVGLRGESIDEGCPFCTDTLILLTVDPITKTAGMLSIPRDIWANIPGFGYSRINTAWPLGRGSRLPGGGPALTMKTISYFIGVPVDYYVQVDFDTFVDMIDLIGGVDIYNEETLILDPVAHGKDYPKVKLTCCGMRHLKGRVALAYARCRYDKQGCKGGDIERAKRQQNMIFAIRDKVLSAEYFPNLLAQAPELYGSFSAGIHTNMSLDAVVKLAVLARDIPKGNIKNAVIDNTMIALDSTILGGQNASIIRPFPDKVRLLRDEIFSSQGPLSPLAQGDLASLMQADEARIRILNGTSNTALDAQTANFLSQKGMVVTELGKTKILNRTIIVLYSPKLYALKFLLDIFDINHSTQILIRPDPLQTVDIEIRLGKDWIGKLPTEE
jgi:LCP family protein required for cell wall assembly